MALTNTTGRIIPGWSPLSDPALMWWGRPDAYTAGTGTLADKSANGINLVQATAGTRPVLNATGGPNGTPILTFDGTKLLPYTGALGISSTSSTTWFAVVKPTSGVGLIANRTGAVGISLDVSSNTRTGFFAGAGTVGFGAITPGYEFWTVSLAGPSAGTATCYFNGQLQTVASTSYFSDGASVFALGGVNSTPTASYSFADGWILNNVPTPAILARHFAYARARYGIF